MSGETDAGMVIGEDPRRATVEEEDDVEGDGRESKDAGRNAGARPFGRLLLLLFLGSLPAYTAWTPHPRRTQSSAGQTVCSFPFPASLPPAHWPTCPKPRCPSWKATLRRCSGGPRAKQTYLPMAPSLARPQCSPVRRFFLHSIPGPPTDAGWYSRLGGAKGCARLARGINPYKGKVLYPFAGLDPKLLPLLVRLSFRATLFFIRTFHLAPPCSLGGDILAGFTVAAMLIPQSVSYATSLAKLSPVTGLVRALFILRHRPAP
jgi:hypothetical protein